MATEISKKNHRREMKSKTQELGVNEAVASSSPFANARVADYRYGFKMRDTSVYRAAKGLSQKIVEEISSLKEEPDWMRKFRLRAYEIFRQKSLPNWGPDLSLINFDDIYYFVRPTERQRKSWQELPKEIKETFEKLGIPEAERKILGGVGAQYESEMVYHSLKEDLAKQGVIFLDTDSALKKYPEIFKEYFGKIVPPHDNKFAALNSAVWSGGSFIYVPEGVAVEIPLQAYFRINTELMGQFERTLIIAEKGSKLQYIEACSAPIYTTNSLHAAVVEIFVKQGAEVKYTTIQNWSNNVYNLVTKRAMVGEEGNMTWIDGNVGCLAKGTKISINSGIKDIEEIESGDKVFAYNEETKELGVKKVLGTKFSGVKPVYRLVLEKGKREILATENHPFLTVEYHGDRPKKLGRYDLAWRHLRDLKIGDYLLSPRELPDTGAAHKLNRPPIERTIIGRNQYGAEYPINTSYKYNQIRLPEVTTEDLLWLFGLFVGDGNLEIAKTRKTGNNRFGKVVFSVPKDDRARDKLTKVVENLFNLKKYTERKDKVTIAYNSLILAEFFKLNGMSGIAQTKRVPQWIFSLPQNQKKAFLTGYLEADGSFRKNVARLKTSNEHLLADIKNLTIDCGIEVNRIQKETEVKKITINGPNTKEKEYTFYIMFISGIYRLRKFMSSKSRKRVIKHAPVQKYQWFSNTKRVKLPEHFALYKITDVISCGQQSTYDLEVEGSHNFIANGIIVHNSKITMKYPSFILKGRGAKGETLSFAYAGKGQIQDTGAKAIHLAPYTTSRIISKSVSQQGGKSIFRALSQVIKSAKGSKTHMRCDALILDEQSRAETFPNLKIDEQDVTASHEAVIGKVGEAQLFYLMSRGLSEREAMAMIITGFLEPIVKEIPLEYALELNRLMGMEIRGF